MSVISLGGLKAAPKKAKVEKPILPDPLGEFAQAVTAGIEAKSQVEAHTVRLDQVTGTLKANVVAHLFKAAHGQANPEDTYQVVGPRGKAMVSFKNMYRLPEDLGGVKQLLGDHAATYLVPTVSITIDTSAIPMAAQQFVVDELVKLARVADQLLLGVEDGDGPVFNAISVKQKTAVDKAFHADRHRLFTPTQNMMLHQAMPCDTSVRFDY